MFSKLRANIRRALSYAIKSALIDYVSENRVNLTAPEHAQLEIATAARRQKTAASGNPLVRCGQTYFSQNDEDGILLEILRRLGISKGCFVEFGVENGLECNSLILLMSGWRGGWIGGETLAFDIPPGTKNLAFTQAWVTNTVIASLYSDILTRIGAAQADVLSMDLDGNDLYFLETLFAAGARPQVLIAEYNGKFPPPIEFSIAYDDAHTWDGSDWCGMSLQSLVNICEQYDYALVACNVTGVNAFFVPKSSLAAFADVPRSIDALYTPNDHSYISSTGHHTSPRTVASFLRGDG